MPLRLQQYLGSFFCHDITNFNASNSEMFRVNTFVNFLFFSRRGENKQATEEIHSFPSLKLSKHEKTRNSLKTAHDIFNRVGGDSKKIRCHKSVLCTKREELILPVKTRVWYRMHESELENGLYHAGNARAHASYILCSTTRKST